MQRVVGNMIDQITTSLGASFNGNALRVLDHTGFSIWLKWTGASAAGTFKLQAGVANGTPSSWEDISGASVVAAGAGQALFNISNAYYSHVRIVFTRTSGTGTITEAVICGKE